MAEIKITKKAPVWPWIILLLIIIGGLFFLFFYGNTEENDMNDDHTTEIEEVTSTNPQNSKLTPLNTEDS